MSVRVFNFFNEIDREQMDLNPVLNINNTRIDI